MATVFPAFLKLEHQPDGSAKSSFLAEVASTLGAAKREFSTFSQEASHLLDTALSSGRTKSGSLSLDVAGLQEPARAAQNRAVAARELAAATELAARTEGDFSQSPRQAVSSKQQLRVDESIQRLNSSAHFPTCVSASCRLELHTIRIGKNGC